MSIDKSLKKSILRTRSPSLRTFMSLEINYPDAPSAVDIMGEYRSMHGSNPEHSPVDLGTALAADAIRYLRGDEKVDSFMIDFVTQLPESTVAEPGHRAQLITFMKTLFAHSGVIQYETDTIRRSSLFRSVDPKIGRVILRQEIEPENSTQPKICRFADPETMLRLQYKDEPEVITALKLIAEA